MLDVNAKHIRLAPVRIWQAFSYRRTAVAWRAHNDRASHRWSTRILETDKTGQIQASVAEPAIGSRDESSVRRRPGRYKFCPRAGGFGSQGDRLGGKRRPLSRTLDPGKWVCQLARPAGWRMPSDLHVGARVQPDEALAGTLFFARRPLGQPPRVGQVSMSMLNTR